MTFFETLGIAWEGLTLNKVRSFLTTLGVIIGVGSVIMMLSVSAGAEAAIAEQINSLGADLIIVGPMRGTPGAAKTFIYEDALAIAENVRGITGVSAEQFSTQNVKGGEGSLEAISILGVTADFPIVRDYELATGRFFTAEENDRKRLYPRHRRLSEIRH
jgi:putative ABC transport system permease protein